MAIYHPPTFINEYISSKIPEGLPNHFKGNNPKLRFFPTLPTDITTLTETFPESQDEVFAVYDRMLKMRRTPFPHIKSEQLLYYFYKMAGDPEALIESTQLVQDLLDREDESANELNKWIHTYQQDNPGTPIQRKDDQGNPMWDKDDPTIPIMQNTARIADKDFLLPFFHRIRVYQLEETRDLIDFGTARTYAGNKIIIDYDWHKS